MLAAPYDENLYMSELEVEVGPRFGVMRTKKTVRVIAKQTVRVIDAEYVCEEIARNRCPVFVVCPIIV